MSLCNLIFVDPNNLFYLSPAVSDDIRTNLTYTSRISVLQNIDRETQLARYDFEVEVLQAGIQFDIIKLKPTTKSQAISMIMISIEHLIQTRNSCSKMELNWSYVENAL